MYRFHFTNEEADYDEVTLWFAERDAAFTLLFSKKKYDFSMGKAIHAYDISVLGDIVALEFNLAFPVKRGRSRLYELNLERDQIVLRMKKFTLKSKRG